MKKITTIFDEIEFEIEQQRLILAPRRGMGLTADEMVEFVYWVIRTGNFDHLKAYERTESDRPSDERWFVDKVKVDFADKFRLSDTMCVCQSSSNDAAMFRPFFLLESGKQKLDTWKGVIESDFIWIYRGLVIMVG